MSTILCITVFIINKHGVYMHCGSLIRKTRVRCQINYRTFNNHDITCVCMYVLYCYKRINISTPSIINCSVKLCYNF